MSEEEEYEEEEDDQESKNKAMESKEVKNPSINNVENNEKTEEKKETGTKKSNKSSKKTASKKKATKDENAYKLPSPEQVVSTRAFLEKTVTSAIQEALLELARKRDDIEDPLLWVGEYLVKKAKEKK